MKVGAFYMSLWPEDAAGKKDVVVKRTHGADFVTSYDIDFMNEGEREPEKVALWSLDETAMIKAFREVRTNGIRYNLMRMNCSSLVATMLEVGSKRSPTFSPVIDVTEYAGHKKSGRKLSAAVSITRRQLCVWTPEQVLRYARELSVKGKRIA